MVRGMMRKLTDIEQLEVGRLVLHGGSLYYVKGARPRNGRYLQHANWGLSSSKVTQQMIDAGEWHVCDSVFDLSVEMLLELKMANADVFHEFFRKRDNDIREYYRVRNTSMSGSLWMYA